MSLLLLAAMAPTPATEACDNKPVYMVVTGITHDRDRMLAYGRAIAESEIYQKLGGYYLNAPVPVATFEGKPQKGYSTIIVRFPCLANARAFWNSKVYQEKIKPMRLNPSAGDYVVRVYPEIQLRADMVGKVGDSGYKTAFDKSEVEQVVP